MRECFKQRVLHGTGVKAVFHTVSDLWCSVLFHCRSSAKPWAASSPVRSLLLQAWTQIHLQLEPCIVVADRVADPKVIVVVKFVPPTLSPSMGSLVHSPTEMVNCGSVYPDLGCIWWEQRSSEVT